MTSALFDVTITTDNVLEGNETFILTIVDTSLSGQGFISTTGAYNKATVTVIDTTSE